MEIDVSKYFETYKDEIGRLFAIQIIGDERELIKEINNQNKQFQQLKAENEGLQSLNNFNVQKIETLQAEKEELRILNKANADNYVKWRDKIETENKELKSENDKYKQCFDEIEEIVNFMSTIVNCDNAYYCNDKLNEILQLIKQTKEGE